MLVVSEFVGCSPSVSGAIRVNPWSIDSLADGIYTAIKMPAPDRHLRHDKHWRYVSQHTVRFWAQASYCALASLISTVLETLCRASSAKSGPKKLHRMRCHALSLGLRLGHLVWDSALAFFQGLRTARRRADAVAVMAQSYMSDLRNLTKDHLRMKCYALGLGLDTFRMVALTQNFRRLDVGVLMNAFKR